MTPSEIFDALGHEDDLEETVERMQIALAYLINQAQLESPFMAMAIKDIMKKVERREAP